MDVKLIKSNNYNNKPSFYNWTSMPNVCEFFFNLQEIDTKPIKLTKYTIETGWSNVKLLHTCFQNPKLAFNLWDWWVECRQR